MEFTHEIHHRTSQKVSQRKFHHGEEEQDQRLQTFLQYLQLSLQNYIAGNAHFDERPLAIASFSISSPITNRSRIQNTPLEAMIIDLLQEILLFDDMPIG